MYEDMLFWRKVEDKLCRSIIQQKVSWIYILLQWTGSFLAGALHANGSYQDRMIPPYRNHVQPIGIWGLIPKSNGRTLR